MKGSQSLTMQLQADKGLFQQEGIPWRQECSVYAAAVAMGKAGRCHQATPWALLDRSTLLPLIPVMAVVRIHCPAARPSHLLAIRVVAVLLELPNNRKPIHFSHIPNQRLQAGW